MEEKEFRFTGGSLFYRVIKKTVEITRYSGNGTTVDVPKIIDGYSVTSICKKAFLSKKNLKSISFPQTISDIGDWAFAYCDELKEVIFQGKRLQFGKAVFLECKSLEKISAPAKPEYVSRLLAAAIKMDAYYLLDIMEAGSREWLSKWDARMLSILAASESDGYSKQVLCGEEDYGSTDLEAYKSGRRRQKIRLLLLRLLYPEGLSSENEELFKNYVLAHTMGCESSETWEIILKEHGDDKEYYSLFAELGCLTNGNVQDILEDIGEEYPEMKAYFMNYSMGQSSSLDFFEDLEL